MTAAVLTYNVPILPSPYDATLTNSTQPGVSEMATGELNATSVLNAVTYNWLHNAATANLYLEQQLGLMMPFNPASTGGSLVSCPSGGVVSVRDSVTGFTQFYVALNNRPVGFADPSTDATNWGLINFANLVSAGIPGQTILWTGSSAPSGYLQYPLTQTNISRTAYANLYAAIGTTWGAGDGSTTFGMPWMIAGSSVLHNISIIGAASSGAVISHGHTTVANNTVAGTSYGMSTNDPHQHSLPSVFYSSSPFGGSGSGNLGGVTNATGSTSIAHTHAIPSLIIPSLAVNNTGGSLNSAAGTYLMLCVKY